MEDIFHEFYVKYPNEETRLLYLVGNKSDKKRREVSFKEAKELADAYGLSYMETSAKTGNNVEAIYMQGVEKIC